MDGRVKKSRKTTVLEALEDVKPGDIVPFINYKKHMVVTEKSGRVVVATDYGIYIAEFDHIDKAKEFIDNA